MTRQAINGSITRSLEHLRHLKLHFELLDLLTELFDDQLSLGLCWLLLTILKLLVVIIIVFCLILARLNLHLFSQLLFLLTLLLLSILQLLLVKDNWLVRLK